MESIGSSCLATRAWRSGFQVEPNLKVDKVLDPPFLEGLLCARWCSISSSCNPPRDVLQLQFSKEEPRHGEVKDLA